MSALDRLLARLLGSHVDDLVRNALAERINQGVIVSPDQLLYKHLVHGDRSRLHIHPTAIVNNALFNVSGGKITIGEYAFFGHNVSILTGTHEVNKFGKERQLSFVKSGRDVIIGEGAWLASHVLVLGPCVIGAHAVVAAGSLVTEDVDPYTIVVGRPARILRKLEHTEAE